MIKKRKILLLMVIPVLFITIASFFVSFTGLLNRYISNPQGVIIHKMSYPFWFESLQTNKDKKRWTPKLKDIASAEKILMQCLSDTDAMIYLKNRLYLEEQLTFISSHLEEYKRQYVGFWEEGKKIIWINAFLDNQNHFSHWKTTEVFVNDGGEAFFNTKIDFEKGICFEFYINGRI